MNPISGRTPLAGEEQYQEYAGFTGDIFVQYDYRAPDGELFSCVARTLFSARERRDAWIKSRRVTIQAKCNHSYSWSGAMPCTGVYRCVKCGKIIQ